MTRRVAAVTKEEVALRHHFVSWALELQVPGDGEQNQDEDHENQCFHGEDLLPPERR